MAQAAHCSQCGTNVYVTEDGRCPQGHGPEFLSNYYEVGDETSTAQAADNSYSQTEYAPASVPGQPIVGQPKKKSKVGLIIGIILAVLLLCGVGVGIATCSLLKGAEEATESGIVITPESNDPAATTPGTQGSDTTPPLESGVARVVLGWDGPADLDLEVWDATGDAFVTDSMTEYEDVTDGTIGREYFDFKDGYGSDTYVISVYFVSENNGPESAQATVTLYKTDGTTETRTGQVHWEPGMDQWHVFSIDAVTGDIVAEYDFWLE